MHWLEVEVEQNHGNLWEHAKPKDITTDYLLLHCLMAPTLLFPGLSFIKLSLIPILQTTHIISWNNLNKQPYHDTDTHIYVYLQHERAHLLFFYPFFTTCNGTKQLFLLFFFFLSFFNWTSVNCLKKKKVLLLIMTNCKKTDFPFFIFSVTLQIDIFKFKSSLSPLLGCTYCLELEWHSDSVSGSSFSLFVNLILRLILKKIQRHFFLILKFDILHCVQCHKNKRKKKRVNYRFGAGAGIKCAFDLQP